MTIHHRPATSTDSDREFMVSHWSSSYKKSHSAGLIQADDWAGIMRPQIAKILDRPGMRATIAYDSDDPKFFYGFIVGDTDDIIDTPVIAYVYVKEPYRRQGIARGLFSAFGVEPNQRFVYACRTGIVSKLSSKIPMARFNPLEVRYPKESRRYP
jgi:GNAT superfamily N-acetyltransferase